MTGIPPVKFPARDPRTGRVRDLFPVVAAAAGPIRYTQPSPAERAAADAINALVARRIGDFAAAQHAAIDLACAIALEHGWDVHVQRHHASRFIGLELAERTRPTRIPTLHHHPHETTRWEDDDL